MKSPNGRYIALFALICLLCSTYALPQAGTGELTGIVTDPTGAVIVGATLELTNSDTGAVRSTISSAAGVYRFVALPVGGAYSLSIRQAGFKAFKVGKRYSEKQINEILSGYHEDTASLRRELVGFGLMKREGGGGEYWRES